MVALSIYICDYYLNEPFYSPRNNWHYISFSLYSILLCRVLSRYRISTSSMIGIVFLSGTFLSLFDEGIQYFLFLIQRVTDLNDVAKDSLGTLTGIIIYLFIMNDASPILKEGWKIRQSKIMNYFRSPLSLLAIFLLFDFAFIIYTSLLTANRYLFITIPLAFLTTSGLFFILHLTKYHLFRIALYTLTLISLTGLFASYIRYHNKNIVYNRYGLTVYKGIPIPFFDFIIYPNGSIRMVDKKHFFSQRCLDTILSKKADIILFGSGANGFGGKGFGENMSTIFYNRHSKNSDPSATRCPQIIILKTPAACKLFNRLKKEGRHKILFVLHNTC